MISIHFLHRTIRLFLSFAFIISLTGCVKKPVLNALAPASGTPGTVVEIQGSQLFGASIRWNANSPAEQSLPGNFLSPRFFTVPMGAATGNHNVRLYGDGQYSDNTVAFNVTAGPIRPWPRLDDVTVSYFNIDNTGEAAMFIMAHGANFDVGSQILINEVAQNSYFSRLLRNNAMNATDPTTLGYPIYHYATVWCSISNQTPGSVIRVRIRNLDGVTSNSRDYKIAANMAELDSDGDGLPDEWETNGYDADGDGTVDVDLPALGALPLRKDLFVEVDWMQGLQPNNGLWGAVENTFATAPILNSDGSQGIAIHIDHDANTGGGGGDVITFTDAIRYDNLTPQNGVTYSNFYTIKQNNFDPNRLKVFRYCVFAQDNGHWLGSSGQAEHIWANDFFVSLGSWGADGQRLDYQTGTFIHELGHTLNLRHGGNIDTNSKDNYNSIMQYGNEWVLENGHYVKYSPSQFSGIDTDCNQLNIDGVYTYSQGQRAMLNENHLDEGAGVCDGVDRDWNENGNIQNDVAFNLDADPNRSQIKDFSDWANIELNFRAQGSNWGNN